MQETGVSILASWQTFYVILGSASATLTGLMFIAITLMSGIRIRVSTGYTAVSAYSTPTVVHFAAVLLIAAIICVPWQALWDISIVLGLFGVGGGIYLVTTVPQIRLITEYQPKLHDWLWYFTFPLILYAALVVAALVLPGQPVLALYAIGAVSILFLFLGLRNAWDLVVFLAIERSHPEDDVQDDK